MSKKENWKQAGKDIGHAFANLGKAIGTTAKVVVGEENHQGEGKKTKTGEAWTNVGHGFRDAGKSFGKATAETFTGSDSTNEKVVDSQDGEGNSTKK